MVLLSFLIAVYNSVVVAWSMLYLFSSMNKEVPWQTCKPEWHVENCTEVYTGKRISTTSHGPCMAYLYRNLLTVTTSAHLLLIAVH